MREVAAIITVLAFAVTAPIWAASLVAFAVSFAVVMLRVRHAHRHEQQRARARTRQR